MEIARRRRPTIHLDMTPMIDCIFQLLIFFMLSSTFLAPKIQLTLPRAGQSAAVMDADVIVVSVDRQGRAFLNTQAVDWGTLRWRVAELVQAAPKRTVTLQCDEHSEHQHFVRALDAVTAAGATQVNVAHQPEQPPGRARE